LTLDLPFQEFTNASRMGNHRNDPTGAPIEIRGEARGRPDLSLGERAKTTIVLPASTTSRPLRRCGKPHRVFYA
jgi:hypothetical protein